MIEFLKEIDDTEKLIKEKIDINHSIDNKEISPLLKQEIKEAINIQVNLRDIDYDYQVLDSDSEYNFVDEVLTKVKKKKKKKKKWNIMILIILKM